MPLLQVSDDLYAALSDLDSDGGRFNTTDRTILQELRRNQSAREAEFVIKDMLDSRSKYPCF